VKKSRREGSQCPPGSATTRKRHLNVGDDPGLSSILINVEIPESPRRRKKKKNLGHSEARGGKNEEEAGQGTGSEKKSVFIISNTVRR